MKEIPIKTTIIKYEAFDGTRFDTDYECKNYESSSVGMLLEKLNASVINKSLDLDLFSNELSITRYNKFYTLVPKTRTDISLLEQIFSIAGVTDVKVTSDDCNNLLVLCLDIECNVLTNANIIKVSEWVWNLSSGCFEVISNIKDSKEKILPK